MQDNWMTTSGERWSYWGYFTGQNLIYTFALLFLPTYLLISGLDAMATAGVLLAVRVWDAVSDILFGGIVDRASFKKGGKFIPWIRISLPAILIAVLLLYQIPPEFSHTHKLIWFAVTYTLFSTAYTLCDVPIYGLVTTMTNVLPERTNLMAKTRITANIGVMLAMIFGFVLPSEQVGISYSAISIIMIAVAAATMIWLCFRGRERVLSSKSETKQTFTLRMMLRYLTSNKYLFIYFGGLLMFTGLNTAGSVLQFACFYLFDSALLATLIAAISFAPSVVIAFIMPSLIKRFDKFRMLFFAAIGYATLSVIIWAVGPILLPHLVLSIVRGFFMGFVMVLQFMFTPDCAEYGQYKTGIEAKGITFAIQTFTMKLTGGLSAALALGVLGLFGWVSVRADSFAELAEMGVAQSDSALFGLWAAYAILPTIGGAMAVLFWSRYKLKAQDVELMTKYNSGEISREECEKQLSRAY